MRKYVLGALAALAFVSIVGAATGFWRRVATPDIRYYPTSYTRATPTGGSETVYGVQPVTVHAWHVFGNNTAAEADSLAALIVVMDAAGGGDLYFPKPVSSYRLTKTDNSTAYITNANTRAIGFVPPLLIGGAPRDIWGSGSPEGLYVAPVGSVYRSTLSGAGDIYVKKSGAAAIGWVLVSGAGLPGTTGDVTAPVLTSVSAFISCETAGVQVAATATSDERAKMILSYRVNGSSWYSSSTSAIFGTSLLHSVPTTRACLQTDVYGLRVAAIDSAGNTSAWSSEYSLQLPGGGTTYPVAISSSTSYLSLIDPDTVQVLNVARVVRNGISNADSCFMFSQWKLNYDGTWAPAYDDTVGWSATSSFYPIQYLNTGLSLASLSVSPPDTIYSRMRVKLATVVATADSTPTAWTVPNRNSSSVLAITGVVVDEVSGTASQDSTITIVGSGFGTKTVVTPVAFDNFEAYPVGTRSSAISGLGSDWNAATHDYPPSTSVQTSASGRAGRSMYFQYNNPVYEDYPRDNIYIMSDRLSASRYIYMDGWFNAALNAASPVLTEDQLQWKSFYIGSSVDGYTSLANEQGFIWCQWKYSGTVPTAFVTGYLEFAPTSSIPVMSPQAFRGTPFLADGTWKHVRIMLDKGDPADSDFSGRINVYEESTLRLSCPLWWNNPALVPVRSASFGEYLGCGTCAEHGILDLYWDDLYVDDTWSRVEIGNSNVYENCTKREILEPLTWSNNQITAKMQIGGFVAGDPVSLFVTNASGTTSNGSAFFEIGDSAAPPPPPGAAITLTAVAATTAGCDGSGDLQLTVHATCSEDSVYVMRQARSSRDPTWLPAFALGDTAGKGPLVATTTISKPVLWTPGSCEQSVGTAYETRIVCVYSQDLTRWSGIYNCADISIQDTPAQSSSIVTYTAKATPDTMLVQTAAQLTTAGNIFTQVARYDTTVTIWKPPYSPTAAPTTGWTATAATSKTQTRRIPRAATTNSQWRVRMKMVGAFMDTTGWVNVDTFTVVATQTYKYYITANQAPEYATGGTEGYTNIGLAATDSTELRTGFINTWTGQSVNTVFGTTPFQSQQATVHTLGVFRNNEVQIPLLYFGTSNLPNFSGSTVTSATITLWSNRPIHQDLATPPDSLWFVGADADTGFGWGKWAQYNACMAYKNKANVLAWPDPDGAGAKTTNPTTWVNFKTLTSTPRDSTGVVGGLFWDTYIPTTIDVTAFYRRIAAGATNGGLWALRAPRTTSTNPVSTYGWYSHTATTPTILTEYRPVLEIIYTK